MTTPKTLFLLYEAGQVAELERLFRERPEEQADSLIVALAVDVEMKLAERSIAYSSAREYKQFFSDLLVAQDTMMKSFFSDPRWAAFTYRGVPLQATFLFMFRAYLHRVYYWGNIILSIIETYPRVHRLTLFTPNGVVFETAGTLARREVQVVIDCAKIVAATHGMSVTVIPPSRPLTSLQRVTERVFFTVRRTLFGLILAVWNTMITVFIRPRAIRLVISDYWRNVSPVVKLLKEAECIFLDRMEIRSIDWRALLRYRMRFVHIKDFLSHEMRMRAKKQSQAFANSWNDMRTSIAPSFIFRGCSFDPLFLRAIDDIVNGFEKTICEIEGTYALYEKFKPTVVMLRASVSGQTHFSVLPLVAKGCGIPSLELQHGLEYLGPGSLSREHSAELIAAYGPLVKRELISVGLVQERVLEIGSPRFDNYLTKMKANKQRSPADPFTILCISPDVHPFEANDSYSAEDYFNALARAAETLKEVQVLIKLRPGPANEALLRAIIAKAFFRVPYSIKQSEPLSDLFAQADTVVSCHSTAVLEALQHGMPVIMPVLNSIDAGIVDFHYFHYNDAHALHLARTDAEFFEILSIFAAHPESRDEIKAKIQEFFTRNYRFDGNASKRLAALITKLARR